MLITLHHGAATGGSVVAQVLSAATNSILTSELNPFSAIRDQRARPQYDPTAMLWHLTYNSSEIDSISKLKYFICQLDISITHVRKLSKNLLIRDHTHTTFNFSDDDINFFGKKSYSLLLDSIKYFYDTKDILLRFPRLNPILSIRHPIDSYISLLEKNWQTPYCKNTNTFDEYCKSMIKLQSYMVEKEYAKVIRYEDICCRMNESLDAIFKDLNISYIIPSLDQINSIKVTGKSGRKSNNISLRERRYESISKTLFSEINDSENYAEYCKINKYNKKIEGNPIIF